PEDADEIEACRRGDPAALEALFRAHAAALARLIGRLCGNPAEVEDHLQETFARAIAGLGRYRGEASPRAWLSGIADDVVRSNIRARSRRRAVQIEDPHLDEIAGGSVAPDHQADLRRHLVRLRALLEQLDDLYRAPFILAVLEGLPLAEVAAI